MGYSARYHAASLAAVFLALAVGILIGVGFGSDLVSGTAADLEESLASDLDEARAEVDALEADLEAEREFGRAVYPAVVGERLRNRQIALVGIGGLPQELTRTLETALQPSGATVGQVAVINEPPNLERLARTLEGKRARALGRGSEEEVKATAIDAARLLARGGQRFDDLRGTLLGRYSGSPEGTDAVVLVRSRPDDLEPRDAANTDSLEDGLLAGFRSLGIPVVGTEASDADPSSVAFFADRGISTVDSIDLPAGQVAIVFALCGASGDFGVMETAESLLPDLLADPCRREARDSAQGRGRG